MVREWLIKLKKNWKIIFLGYCFLILLIFDLNLIFLKTQNLTKTEGGQENSTSLNSSRFPTIGLKQSLPVSISLIFTGDIIPARSVNTAMVRRNNFNFPFEKTADFLKNADLTITNLEAPLVKNCPFTDTGMIFCGDERFLGGLTYSGIDLASLANNHSSNYGQKGIDNTIKLLSGSGIDTVGYSNIVYREIKGIKFAFIGFNGVSPLVPYLGTINKEEISRLIQEARNNADYIVVLFHWGQEYSPTPKSDTIAPFDQVEIGRFTIDNGADLVVGNHPHVVQGYEIYKEKPIFYALGNFIFDQMWSEETREGVVLKIDLNNAKLASFSLYPVKIDDYSQPRFLEGAEKEKVLQRVGQIN